MIIPVITYGSEKVHYMVPQLTFRVTVADVKVERFAIALEMDR